MFLHLACICSSPNQNQRIVFSSATDVWDIFFSLPSPSSLLGGGQEAVFEGFSPDVALFIRATHI